MRLFDLCVAKKLSGGGGGGDSQFAKLVQRTITTASDSEAQSVGMYAFYNCTLLTSAKFPNVISLIQYAFYGCSSLANVEFPSAEGIGAYAFRNCTSLTRIEFPSATYIAENAFLGCAELISLILHKRASLVSTNAIPAQTIVYVESADLDWYSTAANWSTFYALGRIKPISELPSE